MSRRIRLELVIVSVGSIFAAIYSAMSIQHWMVTMTAIPCVVIWALLLHEVWKQP